MSFWSKLGLMDRESFLVIQSEIAELREENIAISEQNRKYLEEIINLRTSELQESNKSEIGMLKNDIVSLNKQITNLYELVIKFEGNVYDEFEVLNQKTDTACKQVLDDLMNRSKSVITMKEELFKDIGKIIRKINAIENKIEKETQKCLDENLVIQEVSDQIVAVKECLSAVLEITQKTRKISIDNGVLMNTNVQRLTDLMEKTYKIAEKNTELDQISLDVKLLSESLRNLWTIMKFVWIDSVLTDIDESVDKY